MIDAFLVFRNALKDCWDELLLLVLMNLVTVLLAVPIVTSVPALGALWYIGHRIAKGRTISLRDYFVGFRRYFWKAWGLALIALAGFAVLLTNLWFYRASDAAIQISSILSLLLGGLFIALTILWLVFQMYPLALLLQQEDQRLRVALRNAAVLLIANPGFSIVLALLLLVVGLVIGFLLLPLWFLILLAFFAVVCNGAVEHLLRSYREGEEPASPEG
jgi:hypothetical protein